MTSLAVVVDRVGDDLGPERTVLGPFGIEISHFASRPSERSRQLQAADAILVNATTVDGEFLAAAPSCKVIVTYGVGYDHIDLDAAKKRGVVVANVPDYCTDEVADHTMALLLTLARRVVPSNEFVRSGGWGISEVQSMRRISGCTLGLVGYGRTGRAVGKRARAFGLDILVFDPYLSPPVSDVTVASSLHDLLRRSDFVSLHAPLQTETAHLLDAAALAELSADAILVNTSRGGLVDLPALVEALRNGRLAGAGLDVFSEEPPPLELLDAPNLVVTPHSAFYSREAILELKRSAAQAVAVALTGGAPTHRLA